MRSSSPAAETRMPVRIGRVSSREAERATRAMVSVKAGAGMVTIWSPPGSGSGGKSSARSVRMWKRAGAGDDLDVLLGGAQLERDVAGGQLAHDVEEQARGEDDGARALDGGLERDAQADLHVGGAQLHGVVGGDLHAGERLHGAARRRHARDDLELGEQLLRRRRQLHDDHLWIGDRSHRGCGDVHRRGKGRTVREDSAQRLVGGPAESVSHVGENCRGGVSPNRWTELLGEAPNEVEGLGVGGDALAPCAGRRAGRSCGCGPPKRAPMAGQGLAGVLAREVHGDLSRPGEARGAAGARGAPRGVRPKASAVTSWMASTVSGAGRALARTG